MTTPRPRIAHIIPSLDHGGAEQLLMRLVLATQGQFDHRIFTLKRQISTIGTTLQAAGIPVESVALDTLTEVPGAIRRLRSRLGGADRPDLVQGWLSRFVRFKDTGTFAQAIARLRETHPNLVAVALGNGLVPENAELRSLLDAHGVADAVRLLGPRDDIAELHAAFDLVMLSSSDSEALPLSILEAMASGLPVAVTAVGDLPRLLDGLITPVPPREPARLALLAASLLALSEGERAALSARMRARIEAEYGLASVCSGYAAVYASLLAPRPNRSSRLQEPS